MPERIHALRSISSRRSSPRVASRVPLYGVLLGTVGRAIIAVHTLRPRMCPVGVRFLTATTAPPYTSSSVRYELQHNGGTDNSVALAFIAENP